MKKILITSLIIISSIVDGYAQELPRLKISDNNQYIVTDNNKPFFWLGGTAWELLHRLNREEVLIYLDDRAAKGFTVIQTVILAEIDGLNTPNAYGDLPLINKNPTQINEKYFEHVDYVIQQAEKLGIYVGLLPAWADKLWAVRPIDSEKGTGMPLINSKNAEKYGELLARRYLNQSNIIWVLGGDWVPRDDDQVETIRAMARGIRKVDTEHLITFHPRGGKYATQHFNDEWLDFDMFQTGHGSFVKDYEFVAKCKAISPSRPIINGEPRYENIPNRLSRQALYGWLDDSDVRISAYWSMLSGAAGYTYGCNDIWQMYSIERTPKILARTGWQKAIHLPGSTHVKYMKELLSLFPWHKMDNNQSIILNENPKDSVHIVCSIGNEKDFILAYTPIGKPITLDLSKMNAETVKAFWFNPRTAESIKIGEFKVTETPEFKPWSMGRGSDFVLVILDFNSNYKLPK